MITKTLHTMKKLFALFALLAMFAVVGCEENGGDDVNPNDKTEQPSDGNEDSEKPDDAYIALNKEVVTFSPDGESVDIRVYSNYTWELTNNCDWVTTSITSGEASDAGVVVTLTAGLTYDDREATILFSCGKAKKILVVSQSLKEVLIADENNTFTIPFEGGSAFIAYLTTVECKVVIPSNAQSWLSLTPTTRGLVSGSATIQVAENTTYSERSAVVKVVAVGNESLVAEYTINQVQNNAIIADENEVFIVPYTGGLVVIDYQSNVECEVVIPQEALSWVAITPATKALVYNSIAINVAENQTRNTRSTTIRVQEVSSEELYVEYNIVQEYNKDAEILLECLIQQLAVGLYKIEKGEISNYFTFDDDCHQGYFNRNQKIFRIMDTEGSKYLQFTLSKVPIEGEMVNVVAECYGVGLSAKTTYTNLMVEKIDSSFCYLIGRANDETIGIKIVWFETP